MSIEKDPMYIGLRNFREGDRIKADLSGYPLAKLGALAPRARLAWWQSAVTNTDQEDTQSAPPPEPSDHSA